MYLGKQVSLVGTIEGCIIGRGGGDRINLFFFFWDSALRYATNKERERERERETSHSAHSWPTIITIRRRSEAVPAEVCSEVREWNRVCFF